MKSEQVILQEGILALRNSLGLLDSERFINYILREKFDYTEWQRNLWKDKSLKQIHEEATAFYENQLKREESHR